MKRLSVLLLVALSGVASQAFPAAVRPVPETMRAAAFDQGGGPEVLSIHTLPVPRPGAGQVLIAVHACSVAVWELDFRQHPNPRMHFPVVLGGDGSGVIVALGPDVHGFKVGEQVYGIANGCNAEYANARADRIARIPKGISSTEAGALAISGLSALQGIDDILQLKAGETIIIHGASGAVGTLAVQLAKLRGAKVLATASTDEGMALATKLGADVVVNGRTGDIAAAAKQFAPHGVDAVFGLAGGDSLEHCIDALRRDGKGRVAWLAGLQPTPRTRGSMRMTVYSFWADTTELQRLNKAVEKAKMRIPVGGEYSLADAAEAHRRLQAGHVLGKLVLLAQ